MSHSKQYIGGQDTHVIIKGLFSAEGGFSYQKMITLTTPEDQTQPWLVEQDGKLWRWDTVTLAWVELASNVAINWGDIAGTVANQTDLQAELDAKENTITAGTNAEYIKGDKTLGNFHDDVKAVGDVYYQPKFVVDEPLYLETDGEGVVHLKVRFETATWNANKVMGVDVKAGDPTADGDVFTFNAGMDYAEWKP